MNTMRWMMVLTALNMTALIVVFARTAFSATDEVPAVLRAHRIELIDAGGRMRARLNTESDGEVVFRLVGENGEIRVKLGAANDGSGLVLMDDSTQPGVHMLAKRNGTVLKLIGQGNRERVLEP